MKFIQFFTLLLAFTALTTTACKKDDNKSRADILTEQGAWQQVKSEEQDASGAWSEVAIDNCSKDDTYTFKADKTLVFDEGATKCADADPQTTNGTWAISADEKTLTLTLDGFGLAFTIIEFSSDKMVVTNLLFGTRDTFQPK